MNKVRSTIQHSLTIMLKDLNNQELKEAADFIVFLKTRSLIDPTQTYFWTKRWQDMEERVEKDKRKGRILGKGSLQSLLHSLKG